MTCIPSTFGAEMQVLHGHVPTTVAGLTAVERLSASKRLDLAIALPLRSRETLTNLLRELYDPTSPNYRRFLTTEQFTKQFGPTEKDYQAVMAFAKANGLKVSGTHPNRTLLDVNGTVADIQRAFRVNLRVYRHPKEVRTFYAPDADPSVSLAVPILSVSGLDNFVLPHPMGMITNFFNQPSNAVSYATGLGPRGKFIGRDFRAAYAPAVVWDGAGESVGLFELDGYYPGDIAAYASLAGLLNVPLTNVLVNRVSGNPGGNNVEVALDIDMAIAMAPGLSNIFVYEGRIPNDILNRMATDNAARQLSSSWSFGPQVDPAREQIFMQFAAQGQSFFQASGDWGAWAGAIYPPSDDPYVTVVGGTSLTTSEAGGAWLSETAWSGSGGGISTGYPIPPWQQDLCMTTNQGSSTMRNIPDVACMADEVIWLVANNGDEGYVGGTSAAAPLWAGFMALVNQKSANRGQPGVGFVNPALYAIGRGAGYAQAFHDITTGNNTNGSSTNKFFAVAGYDLCAGWGTPSGNFTIDALLAPVDAMQIAPGSPLTFAGPPSGPFSPSALAFFLTNTGASPMNWTADASVSWLNLTPTNGVLVSGEPAQTVNVTLTSAADALPLGSHIATVAFTKLGFVQSRQVILNVGVPPVITSQPADQTVFEGMPASFKVGTSPNGPLAYQWRYYMTNLTDGGDVSGSRTDTLTISNVSPANAGAYSVIVSNAGGVVASSNAFLAIVPSQPVIAAQPVNQDPLPGQTVTLSLTAVGSRPLTYRWQRNGVNLLDADKITGSTSAALTISNITPDDAGVFAAIASNSLGVAISSSATVTVASITAPGVAMQTLYSSANVDDGFNPNGLALGANGILYGTTENGGSSLAGTVFQITTNGVYSSLYSFSGNSDGGKPFAGLTQGADGSFYGTTFQGGVSNCGTIFRISSTNALSTLASFSVTNGAYLYAGLTLGVDSNFYGTSYQGGAYARGAVFRLNRDNSLVSLYFFSDGNDGAQPSGGVVQGGDGTLFGTTYKGGAQGYGTVFQLTTNGELNTLFAFDSTNGVFPSAGLTQGIDGNFYGVTSSGGLYTNGTVFRISSGGSYSNLYSFRGGIDGSNPRAALLLGADGNFYGSTAAGGAYGVGTIFMIAPSGELITLIGFDGYNGANPQAALVEDAQGSFYGTTQRGGPTGLGTVFRFSIDSAPRVTSQPANQSVFAGAKVDFNVAVLGGSPLVYRWQKNGTNLINGGNVSGAATRNLTLSNVVVSDSGIYSVIVTNALGSTTSADAVLSVTSSLPYIVAQPTNQTLLPGATAQFSVTALGNLPLSYQWQKNGINLTNRGTISGAMSSTLTLAMVTEADNGTYTVTVSNVLGVAISTGAVLSVIPASAPGTIFSTIHWFSSSSGGGKFPNGLILARDGNLYGTTKLGSAAGSYGSGTIFKLSTNGQFTTLISFTGSTGLMPGSAPLAPLLQDTNGDFYGTTQYGGTNGAGNIFKLTADNTLTNLYSFTGGEDGYLPTVALVFGTNGSLYGATEFGGDYGMGNIFSITPEGVFTNLYSFTGETDGGAPQAALMRSDDGNFYGMTGGGGDYDDGYVFKMTPAGVLSNLYSFTGGPDGYSPTGALIQDSDGFLHGTTKYSSTNIGGQIFGNPPNGTAFRMTTNGAMTVLYEFGFNYDAGVHPSAGVILGSDGNFYGTTYGDTIGSESGPSPSNGTIFQITPDGTVTALAKFDRFNTGAHPQDALVEGPDGSLYGTTTTGGPGGSGTIFRLSFTSAPQITSPPASQIAVVGGKVTFNVAVSGARPLSYHWQKDGTNVTDGDEISGSATRTLTLRHATLADIGTYSVTLSNSQGTAASSAAYLTVISPPAFQSITQSNTFITLVWTATPDQYYQLQSTPDLTPMDWKNVGDVIAVTNNTVVITENVVSNAQQFYRIVVLPSSNH